MATFKENPRPARQFTLELLEDEAQAIKDVFARFNTTGNAGDVVVSIYQSIDKELPGKSFNVTSVNSGSFPLLSLNKQPNG